MTLALIEKEHITAVCKPGSSECCRYLVATTAFACAKLEPSLKAEMDRRVAAGTMNAKGDNCPGWNGGVVEKHG